MDTEKTQEILDAFSFGRLKGEKLQKFNDKMAADPKFKNQAELHKDVVDAIQVFGDEKLKKRIRTVREEMGNSGKTKGRVISLWQKVASIAAIGILALLAYNGFQNSNDYSTGSLYADYYSAYDLNLSTRGEPLDPGLLEINKIYRSGDYEQALTLINKTLKDPPESNKLVLAAGISALELGKLDEARSRFNYITDSNDLFLSDHANWYMAMSFLKEDKSSEAKVILEKLAADPDADHHAKAKEILTLLNN